MVDAEDTQLAEEIMLFLDKHACTSAAYDPDYDEPGDRYTCPDASMLHVASERLRLGMGVETRPWSSWDSGGYAPYNDVEARAWHDALVSKIVARISSPPARVR